jgi:hypothetical protein
MKIGIVFIFIASTLFAQDTEHGQFKTLIIGDWQLDQTEIVDGFPIHSEGNRFVSQENRSKKITITSDSVYNHRDSTLRFYVRNRNFPYQIHYDSLMRASYLTIYEGKARKLTEVESYEIVKCTRDELILRSYHFLNDGLDQVSISIVYTYRKERVSASLSEIAGKWFYCSDQSSSFLSENDSLTFEFTRLPNDSLCQMQHHIDLEFKREQYENLVEFQIYNASSGVFGKIPFTIDPIKQLIYLTGNDESLIYQFQIVNNEKLILSTDR